MAPLFGRLFASEQTRGLSGDTASTVALDDSNPYYNYRLRRHKAEGDVIADPALLWYTSPYVKRRTGLGTHVAAEKGDGTATYTDVLVILSAEDWKRAEAASGEPWIAVAQRALTQEIENFCRRESFRQPHAHRPFGFRFLCDGSPEMHGKSLGLGKGEFVTGLLPNLYTGPVRGSHPVIAVHITLPGVWDGYSEVGKLYNDQLLFTIGNHWLDNFQHPALKEAALYRLQQAADGSFVHIINPDLQDRYQVTSTSQGGASVLTLATRNGVPLGYIVLAVIDPPTATPTPAQRRPDISLPAQPSQGSQGTSDPIPSVAPPMLLDDTLLQKKRDPRLSKKTIIPDAPIDRIFTLQERGALLQKVHFSAFMEGYDVFLGRAGELGTVVEHKAATFKVRKKSVSLVAHEPGLLIGGGSVPVGGEVPLDGDLVIEFGTQRYEYHDLRGQEVDGWPYVGEIRRPASSTYMAFGDEYTVGRSRECRVALPDEVRNDNLQWKASVGDGATIRARTGEIRKSNFYTDSIMVASEHARFDLRNDAPQLVCIARHCYVYVRRNGVLNALFPASSEQEPKEMALLPGDEVMIGNCTFHVGFTPVESDSVATPAAPSFGSGTPAGARPRNDQSWDASPPPPPPPPPAPAPVASKAPSAAPKSGSKRKQQTKPDDTWPPESVNGASGDSLIGLPLGMEFEEMVRDEPTLPGLGEGDYPGKADDSHLVTSKIALPPLPPLPAAEVPPEPPAPEPSPPATPSEDDSWDDPTHPPPLLGDMDAPPPPPAVPPPFPDLPAVDDSTWDEPSISDAPPLPPLVSRESAPPPPPRAETSPPPPPPPPPPIQELEAPPPPPAPPATQLHPPSGTVVCTDDSAAQFELARPMHVIQAGWMVNGEVVCGNHTSADLILPENRVRADQPFTPVEYFRLQVRGKRGLLTILAPSEVLVDENDPLETEYADPELHTIDVIRRDDRGEEDFAIRLQVREDRRLPDPRARLVAIDWLDPLAAALVTRGLPRSTPRTLTLGEITATFLFDGEKVKVSDYLATYRKPDGGFGKFFVQRGEGRFKTAPEDGGEFEVRTGDHLVFGNALYVLREE
jgi:hypothetical protein